jgi:hypothetical protein
MIAHAAPFVVTGMLVCAFQPGPAYRAAASPEIEDFVRQALQDRFRAGDIPDMSLLDDRAHVFVLKEMPRAGLLLSTNALPTIDGTMFELIGLGEVKARAERTRQDAVYLAADDPRIDGATGFVRLGTNLTVPAKPDVIQTCCCVGRAEFKKVGSRWIFVKWGAMTCA